MRKHFSFFLIFLATIIGVKGQTTKKVLFIGNSYTYVNDLPGLFAGIASSLGDSVYHDMYAPGGYTFQLHSMDPNTRAKINSDQWDVVVLQEQSQLPALWPDSVAMNVFPYADSLNGMIKANDSCSITLFYMTWGRENGDSEYCPYYPPVCTYEGMQARLRQSYLEMGQMFNAEVSPVGIAWQRTRNINPGIGLYNSDESHPSINGSYLAACTFYEAVFHKSPVGAAFPADITASDAAILQGNAHSTVYDSLVTWYIDTTEVHAAFQAIPLGNAIYQFINQSLNAIIYDWDFSDGTHSAETNPVHQFSIPGNYTVQLKTSRMCTADSTSQELLILSCEPNDGTGSFMIGPNPVKNEIRISSLFQGRTERTTYAIYADSGKEILAGVLENSNQTINVSGLPEGLYLINLKSGNRFFSRKMVIEK